jgi:hypothetical protein
MSSDNLPRFAATKELYRQFGDSASTWAFFLTLAGMLAVMAVAMADAAVAAGSSVLAAVLAYGAFTLWCGFFLGALWSGLVEDAEKRLEEDDEND